MRATITAPCALLFIRDGARTRGVYVDGYFDEPATVAATLLMLLFYAHLCKKVRVMRAI